MVKQIVQSLKDGTTVLLETPSPSVKEGCLLIANRASVISVGTEKMLVEFGRSGYVAKARQQPDKVKQVLDKVKTDGLATTYDAVKSKLGELKILGNCSAGVVCSVGTDVEGFMVGDRVATNGPHSEIICVPKNLTVHIPTEVTDEEAAFTVLGAIALQGVRLVKPTLGERFVVTGTGLIGLLAVQILLAGGCRVLALDYDRKRLGLAESFGAETYQLSVKDDPIARASRFSGGRGVDGVIIATATDSNQPLQHAAKICRKRGRIILIGTADLKLYREEFYKKELIFQVSCSYGPGRYDANYEEKGQDYPFGYVRWTEQRNMEAVLELIRSGKVDVKSLITHRFRFEDSQNAYGLITKAKEPYLGVVLQYHNEPLAKESSIINLGLTGQRRAENDLERPKNNTGEVVVGVIGAGEFTGRVLLPAISKTNVHLKTIVSSGGISATLLGKKFGFEAATSNADDILNDDAINTIFVTTRHNSHASYVLKALKTWKNVFVEKPLCLGLGELEEIKSTYQHIRAEYREAGKRLPLLMVGFNRRFSPLIEKMKELGDHLGGPKSMIMTVNAGQIPLGHWIQDPSLGGGRIIGEVCHFIDLLRFLANSSITDYSAFALNEQSGNISPKDSLVINLAFADGSIGNINYFANGHKAFPKEKLEIFCSDTIMALENFRKLNFFGFPGLRKMKTLRQEKGHSQEILAYINAVKHGSPSPISFEEIEEVTRISILINELVKNS